MKSKKSNNKIILGEKGKGFGIDQMLYASGVGIDKMGYLYAADKGNGRIFKILI